jgi:hypothetical protein
MAQRDPQRTLGRTRRRGIAKQRRVGQTFGLNCGGCVMGKHRSCDERKMKVCDEGPLKRFGAWPSRALVQCLPDD